MYKINNNLKSFTLIELLVVLALVAILSVVVVTTLNPAELLKQARDSNRLSDLSTINTALNLFSSDVVNGFMGTSTVIYVSIPDTSPTCSNLGLPGIPTSTYTYNCVTSANLRNTDGTGWIPVNFQRISSNSPISQLIIDPINTTTSLNYYTYVSGGSWKLSVLSLESQKYQTNAQLDGGVASNSFEIGTDLSLGSGVFPAGWIKVPGNSIFGTSDFWVMKYEAKCIDAGSGTPLASPATVINTYSDSATNCTVVNSRHIGSVAGGYPIANVSNPAAYCQTIGAHLITNNEWQTISWNAQNNAINWTNGSVGSGSLYVGHSDGTPNTAFVATMDSDGYYGTGQTSGNQKRTLILSNGSTIWDMAGNIWELTNDFITAGNQPYGPGAGFNWREFTAITNWGTMTQQTAGPANSAWSYVQGVGQIYSWDGTAGSTNYVFLRGGSTSWNFTHYGIGTIFWVFGGSPSSFPAYQYVGFRCAR